jgi:hypothetical protein
VIRTRSAFHQEVYSLLVLPYIIAFLSTMKNSSKEYFFMSLIHCKIPINKLTPWSRVLHEKLIATQVVKKLPIFYETQRFIAVFATAHHCSLS